MRSHEPGEMLQRLLAGVRRNAIAYLALFVALSGTAFAASSALRPNSVGTAQLKNRAVTGPKVALGTLTGANVAKASLTGANIKSATLGTVPNAARLAGLAPASLQHAIVGKCSHGQAIDAVSAQGKVTCQTTGTIKGVIAGTGLTGGGTSGSVSVAVDPTVVQARVTGSCGVGHALFSVRQDGTIGCRTTNVTQMMGGTGTATLGPTSAFLDPVGIAPPSTQVQGAQVGTSDSPSTARSLFVTVAPAPAAGAGWTFDFYVNGRNRTGLKCVITGPASSCHTAGGSVSLPRGARVALHETGTNVATAPTATFGWTDSTS